MQSMYVELRDCHLDDIVRAPSRMLQRFRRSYYTNTTNFKMVRKYAWRIEKDRV
jgi:hypothetical protein